MCLAERINIALHKNPYSLSLLTNCDNSSLPDSGMWFLYGLYIRMRTIIMYTRMSILEIIFCRCDLRFVFFFFFGGVSSICLRLPVINFIWALHTVQIELFFCLECHDFFSARMFTVFQKSNPSVWITMMTDYFKWYGGLLFFYFLMLLYILR